MKLLLSDLTKIQSVSGEEKYIFQFIESFLKKNKIYFTRLKHGDLLVGSKKPKLLFTAHVDEVGFFVDRLLVDGTCSIKGIGWVYPWLFAGREVQIRTKYNKILQGLVLYDRAFDKSILNWNKLKVDFGLNSKDECEKNGIHKNVIGTYSKKYWETKNRIFSTALDNRLGVYLLLRFIEENSLVLEKGISFAFTSDEEMNNIGAKKTVLAVDPEYLCVVDVMPHSLLGKRTRLDVGVGPYILDKTLDYGTPADWRKILQKFNFNKVGGKNKYLKNSEPKIFQKLGYENSINLLCLVLNYHHGVYGCYKSGIESTFTGIKKIAGDFV